MKKKLLVSAIAATAATTGAFAAPALAQISITTQDANAPFVASGGTVTFENQIVKATNADDLSDGDTIVLALPAGMNFVGTPTATSTIGDLRLEGNDLGDPNTQGLVTVIDTNNDGQNDRASVVVARNALAGDQVVFSGSATWTGTHKASDADLLSTIFVDRETKGVIALESTVLAQTVSALSTPVAQVNTSAITIPNQNGTNVSFSGTESSELVLTVPAGVGKAGSNAITLTLGTGLAFNAGAAINVTPLTDGAPALTISAGTNTDGDNAVTFNLGAATTTASQYLISIDGLDVTGQPAAGTVNASLSGNAGLSGSAPVAILGASGSTAALPANVKAADTKLVAGAEVVRDLPNIVITETFAGDIANGTITITAGPGLVFDENATVNAVGTEGLAGAVSAVVTDEDTITVTVGANAGVFDAKVGTITVSGIEGTVEDSASGALNVEFGGTASNAPNSVLDIATAVARGAVEIEGPDPLPSVGAGAEGVDAVITLNEETYAAITNTAANTAYILITPPAGVTINTVSQAGMTSIEATGEAVVPENGSFLIEVTGESDAADEAEITINYDVADSVAVGSELVFTLGGNANVEGSVVVATVANSTKTIVGTIPSVDVGNVNSQALASFTIQENIASGMSDGSFRVQAPAGVTFAPGAATVSSESFAGTVTATSTATFTTNDTLLVSISAVNDAAIESLTVQAKAFVAASVTKDALLAFTITDGDLAGSDDSMTGVTGGSVNLAYTGDVEALEVGAAGTVNVGFSLQRTIEGGLEGEGFTVSSSNEAAAEAEVDGRTITVRGLSAGTSTITVTDSLGSTDTFLVTVGEGAEQEELTGVITSGGVASSAVLRAGASVDGGNTYDTEFSTDDVITVVGSIEPEAEHVGQPGEVFVVVRALVGENNVWGMLNEDGIWQGWDARPDNLEGLVPAAVVDSLAEVEYVDIHNDTLPAGTYRIRVGYMAEGGQLIFNENPLEIVVE